VHPTDERLNRPGGLAERLYGMRKVAGLTGARLAEEIGWPPSKVSKIENGRQTPSSDDIRAWAAGCGQPGEARELLDMLADVQAVHRRWQQRLRRGNAAVQEDLDRRTREATRIRCAEILLMPGLLQTAGYARSIAAQVASINSNSDIDATVEAKMRRQEVLYDTSRTFQFVIAEAALRTLPCPVQVMAGHLDRLLSLDLDNVTLGIIPMGTELDLAPVHGFLILDDTAIVETYSEDNAAGEEESTVYGRIFERLMAEAVTGDDARRLIAAAAASLRGGSQQ
jgi:transcriptional regulator with XRE-family HTH domain